MRGRGEGSVYRRGDGYWVGQVEAGYTRTGSRRRARVVRKRRADAVAALDELRRAVEAGAVPDRTSTVATFLEFWLAEVATGQVAESSLAEYAKRTRRMVPTIGKVKLHKLSTARTPLAAAHPRGMVRGAVQGRHRPHVPQLWHRGGEVLVGRAQVPFQQAHRRHAAVGVRRRAGDRDGVSCLRSLVKWLSLNWLSFVCHFRQSLGCHFRQTGDTRIGRTPCHIWPSCATCTLLPLFLVDRYATSGRTPCRFRRSGLSWESFSQLVAVRCL